MNSLEYLNSISHPAQAASAPSVSLLDQKPVKIGLFALIGVAILAIILMLLGNNSTPSGPAELGNLEVLYSRLTDLSSKVSTYNKQIKSSSLRSAGGSLSAIITNTTSTLSSLLASDYGVEPEKIVPSAELSKEFEDSLATLEKARLNGLLDRAYANELEYAVSVILAVEDSALGKTENESLKSALESSTSSLKNIESDLKNYLKTNK